MKSDERCNTAIEKMGFKDMDLRSNVHDQIVLKMLDFDFLFNLLSANGIRAFNRGEPYWTRLDLPEFKQSVKIVSELPINRRGFIVGFIDLRLNFPRVSAWDNKNEILFSVKNLGSSDKWVNELVIEIKSECFNLGELLREINFYKEHYEYAKYIREGAQEVDIIDSLSHGYSAYPSIYCVASSKCDFIPQLESQGIKYIDITKGEPK